MYNTNIYILKLESNKYYIGKSKNIEKRYNDHLNGYGSVWTKIYKPIEILKIINNVSPFEEDKYVKEYMNIYGIDNVRGGSYVKETLNIFDKISLKKELWGANDLCLRCGSNSHFIKNCNATTDIYNCDILDIYEDSSDDYSSDSDDSIINEIYNNDLNIDNELLCTRNRKYRRISVEICGINLKK
jgi:hypothetical protein